MAENVNLIAVGTAKLDTERRVLILADGTEDRLSPGEFALLVALTASPNRAIRRELLLKMVTNREPRELDRSVDNRIMRLRRKIERDPRKPQTIRSISGVGYIFVPAKD